MSGAGRDPGQAGVGSREAGTQYDMGEGGEEGRGKHGVWLQEWIGKTGNFQY